MKADSPTWYLKGIKHSPRQTVREYPLSGGHLMTLPQVNHYRASSHATLT